MFVKFRKLSWIVENHKISYFLKDIFLNREHILSIYETDPEIHPDAHGSMLGPFTDIIVTSNSTKETITVIGTPEKIIETINKKRILHD